MTPPEAPVEIVPYDPSWPVRFEEEAAILRRGLAAWLVGPIEHIGSTAVPGLAAKPVMQPEVAAEYETLKRKLAGQYRLDREAYTQAKRPFIDRVTDVALERR